MSLVFGRRGPALLGSAALIIVSLTGCSLFNPHIGSTVPRPAYQADGTAVFPVKDKPAGVSDADTSFVSKCGIGSTESQRFAGGLGEAVCYVNGYREAYHGAVGNDALLRTVTGTALIPISAAALYLGVTTDDSTEAIAALALSGASLFGLSSLLQSTPRQHVYIAGSQAMGCALLAMRPFMMPQSEYRKLVADLETLYRQINITSDEAKRGTAPASEIAAAEELVAEARQVHGAGARLRRAVETAGFMLTVAADNIANKVDELVVDTEPDLTSLLGISGSLHPATAF